jgi:hypothetical protein
VAAAPCGTALTTSNFYNPNISQKSYFRADEYPLALEEATRVAAARRDTKALPIEAEQKTDPVRYPFP